jgi:hypothetical protein
MRKYLNVWSLYSKLSLGAFIIAISSVSSSAEPVSSGQSIEKALIENSDTMRIDLIVLKEAGDVRSISFALGAGPSGSLLVGESGYIKADGTGVVVDNDTAVSTPEQVAVGTFSQIVVFSPSVE